MVFHDRCCAPETETAEGQPTIFDRSLVSHQPRPLPVREDANIAQLVDFKAIFSDSESDDVRREEVRHRVLNHNRKRAGLLTDGSAELRKIDGSEAGPNPQKRTRSEAPRYDRHEPPVQFVDPRELYQGSYRPPDFFKRGPYWEGSNLYAGELGYGYKPDGTPTGSDYILHMRDQGHSNASNTERPFRRRYRRKEGSSVTRPTKRSRTNHSVRDQLRRDRQEEEEQLSRILKHNPEFEL